MPVDPVSIGLSVGGSALKSIGKRKAQKKQDKILAAILARQGRQQAELDKMLLDEVGTMRGETPEAERDQAMSEFVGQLRSARAAQPTNYGARGAVSDREVAETGELQRGLGQFSDREADITSRLDAPGRMRENQSLRQGRLGTSMQQLMRKMDSDEFLGQLRLARVRPNKWLSALGSVMTGAGNAMAGGGIGSIAGRGSGSSRSLMQLPGGFDPEEIYG